MADRISNSLDTFLAHGYQITDDPRFADERLGLTPQLNRLMDRLYIQAREGGSHVIKELKQLVAKHPEVPLLKNFLMVAYGNSGYDDKAREINDQILREHPEYLFGKINEALRYIELDEFDRVKELVGDHWDLKKLYPERKIFALGEVIGFHKLATYFYSHKDDLENAEHHLSILTNIAPDHPETGQALEFVMPLRLKQGLSNWKEQMEKEIRVRVEKTPPQPSKVDKPVFIHPEMDNLYEHGIDISPDILRGILELPRNSLIQDLLTALRDGILRYGHFNEKGWDENTCHFPLHALWLLKELKASEALEQVLVFFEYELDFLEFWFGDHLHGGVSECFIVLGQNHLEVLKDFLLKPGIDTYAKSSIAGALAQIGLQDPGKRSKVIRIFAEIFEIFGSKSPEENLLDTVFVTSAVSSVVDAGYSGLLPAIKTLDDLDYIDPTMFGPYSEIEKYMAEGVQSPRKMSVHSVFDYYQDVLQNWFGYQEQDDWYPPEPLPTKVYNSSKPAVSKKIGRNEVCPCGSGKKYKKCCLSVVKR